MLLGASPGTLTLSLLLVVHTASTWAMVGLIWLVQIVHYPLFRLADPARFATFCERHRRLTTRVVAPLMLVEAATATLLLLLGVQPLILVMIGWLLVVAIGISTAIIQGPLHKKLLRDGYDGETIDRLVSSNWLRTLLWSTRGLLAGWLLAL